MRKKISNFVLGVFGFTVDAKIAAAKKLQKRSTDALVYAMASINKSVSSKDKEIKLIQNSILDDKVKKAELIDFVNDAAKPFEFIVQ